MHRILLPSMFVRKLGKLQMTSVIGDMDLQKTKKIQHYSIIYENVMEINFFIY